MFKDRIDAGLQLVYRLEKYKKDPGVVLAIPRGGIPVAYVVAMELGFPLEVILTKKIGHPLNKEYAIGAACLTDYFVIPHEDVTQEYIADELKKVRARLQDMQSKFMGDKKPINIEGKTVIIVDDGIATGNTMFGIVHVLRKSKPGKIVIAVPVASESAILKLSQEVDEVIALSIPEDFFGVGAYYNDFKQVNDEEVVFYLNKLSELSKVV
jgi:predicted phosphoribosyltransferase